MSSRRKFIQQLSAAGALGTLPGSAMAGFSKNQNIAKIWACLLHLSYNFWVEYSTPSPFRGYRPLSPDER